MRKVRLQKGIDAGKDCFIRKSIKILFYTVCDVAETFRVTYVSIIVLPMSIVCSEASTMARTHGGIVGFY